ncbi:MAG TPA: hypothetical protein ACFYD6_01070 [Candidatus Brocadiia bacterium]|nr:hypothetical protein [Candidatus Brocadiales bacterium]
MGEEGKKKKLVYEQPRLVNLNGAKGAGDCVNGSGPDVGGLCGTGNSALGDCDNGNTADDFCLNGSLGTE